MNFQILKKLNKMAAATGAILLLSMSTTFAGTVGVGTTKGGATAAVSAGLANVVSTHSGHQMRPQPMGGTNQYIPIVNAGELEFGISNAMPAYMAISGTGLSEGSPNKNLRLVASLMTFKLGLFVRADSDIKSIADLRGKRIPSEFTASPLFRHLMAAHLTNAGLGWDDVTLVPQPALRQHWAAFGKGEIDVAIGAIGSGSVKQASAAVGGIRFLPLAPGDEAEKRTLTLAPKSTIKTITPSKPILGVTEPIDVLHYTYLLWASKDVSDNVVYDVVKSIYDNEEAFHAASPLWRSHRSKTMSTDFGPEMQYHPAAIRFFEDVGIWSR